VGREEEIATADGGIVDKLKGRVKEALGALRDDDEMKREGQIDQKAGDAKGKADELVDKARDVASGEKDSDERRS
jgi:uncharacterized protein YjbJ (UPF0337 family)